MPWTSTECKHTLQYPRTWNKEFTNSGRKTKTQDREEGEAHHSDQGEDFSNAVCSFNFENTQCFHCQQMGHILCFCPQHTWNKQQQQPQQRGSTHRTQTNDYYEQEEPLQVAHTIADNHTPQEHTHEILGFMANQEEVVKDKLIKELRNGGDFPSAWTQWPGWGLYVVTLYTSHTIDLCKFQFQSVQVTSQPIRML